jgi:subtilase family serine protease
LRARAQTRFAGNIAITTRDFPLQGIDPSNPALHPARGSALSMERENPMFANGLKRSDVMRRWFVTLTTMALMAGTSALPASAGALLSKHVPGVVAGHQVTVAGAVDRDAKLHLQIALPMRNQDALHTLIQAIYDPTDPSYHHYLSVAEFTEHFGPTQSDYAKAAEFFGSSGLHVTALTANRYMIEVEGRAADIERVFHVKLNLYKHPTENRNFMAPDREPTVDLGVAVLHVTGLDNFVIPKPRFVKAPANDINSSGTGSGPGGNFIGSDMRAAYYGGSTLTGAGQSLGLMELEGWNPADVTLYFSSVNQPLNVPVNGISTDGTPITCTSCDDSEQALDIEYAISMAPSLAQVQVYVASSPESVLERMVSDNTSKVLSTSWGWDEDFATDDPLWQEMAVQGQSFLTASGDFSNLQASGPWPEEDANLIAVGGTDLVTNGPGGSYKSETGWSGSAGGASLDKKILIEPYQLPFINKKNKGSKTLRNVPDIAAHANTNCYICADGGCFTGVGGTSFASPMWTGFLALANEQAADNGKPAVGFINPAIYEMSAQKKTYKKIFHDVTSGRSGVNTAVKGFDLVTGLGSEDGQAIIDALTK